MSTTVIIALWLIAFTWVVILVLTLRGVSRQRPLLATTDLHLTSSERPLVSILVPARNEERRVLESCIRSILAQDYNNFEVIAIDDRSTDNTGAILKAIAESDERLRVIDGQELPSGWLGKPFAMQQALNDARGEWVLATDADMIFERSALRIAVDHALRNNGDALTLIPRFETGSFWERVMIPTWEWVFLMFTVFYRIHDQSSDRAAGIGGFFLLRRAVLDRVGGYEALKNEVLEDVRLAERIKRSGARLLIERAPALIRTRMYSTFGEMWECSTKNWFAGVNFSFWFALLCVVSMYAVAVVPALIGLAALLALALGANGELIAVVVPAAVAWMLEVLVMTIMGRRSAVSPIYALTAPLGLALTYAMLFDSSVRVTTGTGVTWKGRKIYERHGVQPPT